MEQIYTIPVNEAFDAVAESSECGCPFCVLYRRLQKDELDIILGASMMEPDIRIQTNKLGFCHNHYSMMLRRRRMLGVGLILESHLDEVAGKVEAKTLVGSSSGLAVSALEELEQTCYVCSRIGKNLGMMTATAVYLWETDDNFRAKFRKVPYFCLPHYKAFIDYASRKMSKKNFKEFYKIAKDTETKYVRSLRADVSKFCKSFSYEYNDEPLESAKDSIPRTEKFLSGSFGWEE